MVYSRSKKRVGGQNLSWFGFVDALSTLFLVIIFLLSIFMLAQFFLGQQLSGRDEALKQLHLEIYDLAGQLSLKKNDNNDLHLTISKLSVTLQQVNLSKDAMTTRINELEGTLINSADSEMSNDALNILGKTQKNFLKEQKIRKKAQNEIKVLKQQINAVKQQLVALVIALEASEKKDKEQQITLKSLSSRLNAALASKVQEYK